MNELLGDSIYREMLIEKLRPYVERANRWWEEERMSFVPARSGSYSLSGDDTPRGMMIRFATHSGRSAIKGLYAYPYVPSAYLTFQHVAGGFNKMLERECANTIVIDGVEIIWRAFIPSLNNHGAVLCFVRQKELLESGSQWLPITHEELIEISNGTINSRLLALTKTLVSRMQRDYVTIAGD